jgi:hypothetical protein
LIGWSVRWWWEKGRGGLGGACIEGSEWWLVCISYSRMGHDEDGFGTAGCNDWNILMLGVSCPSDCVSLFPI